MSWTVLSAVLLTSMVFSLGGFVNALFAKNFDHISWFPTFVLTPLTYLGGVFYSITMLPAWAQAVSHVNPILYMVSAFRYGFLGSTEVDLWLAYGIMIGAAAIMFALAGSLLLEAGCKCGYPRNDRAGPPCSREPIGGGVAARASNAYSARSGPLSCIVRADCRDYFQGVE